MIHYQYLNHVQLLDLSEPNLLSTALPYRPSGLVRGIYAQYGGLAIREKLVQIDGGDQAGWQYRRMAADVDDVVGRNGSAAGSTIRELERGLVKS